MQVLSCPQPSSIPGLVASWTIFLQTSLPAAALIASSIVNPVHDVTLFIQFIFGLPRALDRGIFPSMMSSSRDTDFQTVCPKCFSFLSFIVTIRLVLCKPNFCKTHSFDHLSVQLTLRTRLLSFILNAQLCKRAVKLHNAAPVLYLAVCEVSC